MPGGLDPAVAADHRRGDRGRLAEHHQIPGPDRPRAGGCKRRPPVLADALTARRAQVRDPDGDHARPREQLQPGLHVRPGGTGRQAPGYATLARQRSSPAYQDI